MRLTQLSTLLISVYCCTGCADQASSAQHPSYSLHKGVHSGLKERVDFYYSVLPTCEIAGYPDVRIRKAPVRGKVSIEKGEGYPTFAKDNVRWDCNRKLVGSTQVYYQSNSEFHGNDSFTIEVWFPDSTIRTVTIFVEVL